MIRCTSLIVPNVYKRTYWEYYVSLIKTKHLIVFTFYTYSDYNSRTIKISLLSFSFSLNFALSSLFFVDETIHEIYINQGNFQYIYQLPKILYSAIISFFIITFIKYFALSEKIIIELKEKQFNEKDEAVKMLKCLTIKFTFFFIFLFIFLIIFWYYLSCLSAVYYNSQCYLIKSTLISYSISLLYPLITYLISGIFRIHSLKAKKKDKECMYNISKILQLL